MKLLKDDEIVPLVEELSDAPTKIPLLIAGGPQPKDWFTKDSPVQPSSLDLHIGKIFLPGTKNDDVGGVGNPKNDHVLMQGETAILLTAEELTMPSDIAGIAFPPSEVSFRGLLMTNPGHVDPGFSGHMRFAAINMGKDPYVLHKGAKIVTLLLCKLSGDVKRCWTAREGLAVAPDPTQQDVNNLSPDFLDMKDRMTDTANAVFRSREWWFKLLQVIGPLLVAALAAFGIHFASVRGLERDVAALKEQVKVLQVENRLNNLENTVFPVTPQPQKPADKTPTPSK
jgi:dCTP deaminase